MAEGTPGAFIPHDTAVGVVRKKSGGLNDLLLLSGIVLFVASAALAIAVFLYQQYLETESASKLAQLQRAKAAFEPSLIQELTRLDDRMHAADGLLSAHVAPSAFFHALEQATLATVAFQSLDFQATDARHITVKMQGIAQSVNSIALQADLFSKNGVITSPIFSGIARQPDGVHFNLSAVVNPNAINYTAAPAPSTSLPPAAQPSQSSPSAASPFGGTSSSTPPATSTPAQKTQ